MGDCEKGRIPPLNTAGGQGQASTEGMNSLVFAADLALSPSDDSSSPTSMALALKGQLPLRPSSSGYSVRLLEIQKQDWTLPLVLGAHPHLVHVRHWFFGSSALCVPWMPSGFWDVVSRRTTWLVMPRYAGSLSGAVRGMACTGSREAGLWLLQAVDAVRHMLQRGVVHRDVKPDNFFLAGDGRLVLGDLGEGALLFEGGVEEALAGLVTGRVGVDGELGAGAGAGTGIGGMGARGTAVGGRRGEEGDDEEEEVYEGAGAGSEKLGFRASDASAGGAPLARAPELFAMMRRELKTDSSGHRLQLLE